MANHKIPRLSDRDIAEKLVIVQRDIAKGAMPPQTFAVFNQSVGPVAFPEQDHPGWRALQNANGSAIDHFGVNVGSNVTLHYYRGGQQDPKSPYFDEIAVSCPDADASRLAQAAALVALFRPHPFTPSGSAEDANVAAMRAMQEGRLDRLETLHEEGVRRAALHLEELEKRYQDRVAELEKEAADKKAHLDDEAAKERDRLTVQADALEERKKALDDRDNTHARRHIRDLMLADVKSRIERFGVSEATEKKRGPVGGAMIAFILAMLIGVVFTSIEILRYDEISARGATTSMQAAAPRSASEPAIGAVVAGAGTFTDRPAADFPTRVWAWVRLSLLTFGAVGMGLYYIRWLNRWAEQHTHSEFALQQFHIDVNRANWVLESCLEWRKVTESAIPAVLLESITRGLFTPPDAPKDVPMHPADQLASAIMGTASKVKLRAGETEVEIDKPGKKLKGD